MELNYEYNGHQYAIKVEKKGGKGSEYSIAYDGKNYAASASEIKPGYLNIRLNEQLIKCVISNEKENRFVFLNGDIFQIKRIQPTARKLEKKEEKEGLASPISGKIVSVKVEEGSIVKKGDVLMVIEAMKMEYPIKAPHDGKVKKINFKINDQIEMGATPLYIEKED